MKTFSPNRYLISLVCLFVSSAGGFNAQASSQDQFNKMAAQLHLTDRQKMQLAPILQEEKKQTEALKGDSSLSKAAKFQKYRQIQEHFHYQASQVLNENQLAGLEQMQKQQRREMLERH